MNQILELDPRSKGWGRGCQEEGERHRVDMAQQLADVIRPQLTVASCVAHSGAGDAVAARELHGEIIYAFEACDVQERPCLVDGNELPFSQTETCARLRIRID